MGLKLILTLLLPFLAAAVELAAVAAAVIPVAVEAAAVAALPTPVSRIRLLHRGPSPSSQLASASFTGRLARKRQSAAPPARGRETSLPGCC